jgi:hypothetical protein
MQHVLGYLRRHWTPPSGKYPPHIALVDAIVIDLQLKNMSCGVVKSLSKASI